MSASCRAPGPGAERGEKACRDDVSAEASAQAEALCEVGSFSGACRRRLRYGAPLEYWAATARPAVGLAKEEALAKSGPRRPPNSKRRTRNGDRSRPADSPIGHAQRISHFPQRSRDPPGGAGLHLFDRELCFGGALLQG